MSLDKEEKGKLVSKFEKFCQFFLVNVISNFFKYWNLETLSNVDEKPYRDPAFAKKKIFRSISALLFSNE